MSQRRIASFLVFICAMFIAGHAAGGPAWFVPGGGGGSSTTPSGTALAGEVTFWTSPTAISGNTKMTYTAGSGVFALNTDGSAATPAFTMGATADPDTGIWHPAANTLDISTAGVDRSRWGTNVYATGVDGQGINGTTTEVGLQVINNGGTRARVDLGRPDNGTMYANWQMNVATGDVNIGVNGPSSANLTIGTTQAATQIKISTAGAAAVNIDGTQQMIMQGDFNWIPNADGAGSVGLPGTRFKQVYGVIVHSGDLYLEDEKRGAGWILREEVDGISAINKVTGKHYRLAMVEDDASTSAVRDESVWHHMCRAVGVCQ